MIKEQSKITFALESDTSVSVIRDGKQIGRVWSMNEDGTKPYPHNDTPYCLNSVQICGFDKISEIWGCGPFEGKKDCVIHFVPYKEEYYQHKIKEYEKYVESFFSSDYEKIGDEVHSFVIVNKNKDLKELKSFTDWCFHNI
jgi:hypothetical protein